MLGQDSQLSGLYEEGDTLSSCIFLTKDWKSVKKVFESLNHLIICLKFELFPFLVDIFVEFKCIAQVLWLKCVLSVSSQKLSNIKILSHLTIQ